MAGQTRNLALFNLAIDSKLRGRNLFALRVRYAAHDGHLLSRASELERKTLASVRLELMEQAREAMRAWIEQPPGISR
jgi:hypothetical protein